MNKYQPTKNITAEYAELLIKHAAIAADEVGTPMVISIVDASGSLKAFLRMDGASLSSIDVSQNKAHTSAATGLPTHQWHQIIKDDEPLRLGFPHTDRLVIFGGGFPVLEGDEVIGAIGVSGGHYSQDMTVAQKALEAAEAA